MMFWRDKNKEKSPPKQNSVLRSLRKKVALQAFIAVQTIVITVALIFGMSAAWYTNVLQSSGLQFEAEAWGFTGSVMVTEEPITAGPGDVGSIGLHVTNLSEEPVDVALNVSKSQMSGEMQKRLFFYVDTQINRFDENVERVYINTRDSFTYSVLGYNELVLTKDRANDAMLKWQWVYDMLGYYFLGTVTQEYTEQNLTINANITDYLRPVEYDLDKAVFRDGVLESVDGVTTEQLIQQLSASDGYEQDLVAAENMPGYYKVDVDDTGYGVWVYLCNWAEIQQATTFDSQLGKAAADAELAGTQQEQFIARLTVIGQVKNAQTLEATTVQQVLDGLESGSEVVLQNDLVLTEALNIPADTRAMLDLNGYTITAPAGDSVIKLEKGAQLTVIDGVLDGALSSADVVQVQGGSLTLHEVEIVNAQSDAIYIADENGVENSIVRIFDSQLSAKAAAVYVRGNGNRSSGRTQVFIENSRLDSDYIAITGNGTSTYWGTEVQIYQSQVTGKYAAIYQPQSDSITKVVESTLSGITGIAIKAGELHVVDSTVSGTGPKQEPAVELSGFTDTGDGILVDSAYEKSIFVSVSGNSNVTSVNSYAIQLFEPKGNYATIIVTGGTFSSDVTRFLPDGYVYNDGIVTQTQGGTDNG